MSNSQVNPGKVPIFKDRLNELIGDKSVIEFANDVGISRQTLGFYKNGDRIPDIETLQKLCQACHVSADWLLGFTDDPSPNRSAVDDIGLNAETISHLRRLSPSDKSFIENFFAHEKFPLFLYSMRLVERSAAECSRELIHNSDDQTKFQLYRAVFHLLLTTTDISIPLSSLKEIANKRLSDLGYTFSSIVSNIIGLDESIKSLTGEESKFKISDVLSPEQIRNILTFGFDGYMETLLEATKEEPNDVQPESQN